MARLIGAIDVDDLVTFWTVAASDDAKPVFEVKDDPINNTGQVNLSLFSLAAWDFSFETLIQSASVSWQEVLNEMESLQTILDNAAAYSKDGTGSRITYSEQYGDQSSPTVYNIVYGKMTENRTKRSIPYGRTFVKFELHCEGALA